MSTPLVLFLTYEMTLTVLTLDLGLQTTVSGTPVVRDLISCPVTRTPVGKTSHVAYLPSPCDTVIGLVCGTGTPWSLSP